MFGACAALGRSGGLLKYWAFSFSLSCAVVCGVARGWGGSRGLWGGGVRLCLGSWLWGWISRGSFGALGLVMALSFHSFFYIQGSLVWAWLVFDP